MSLAWLSTSLVVAGAAGPPPPQIADLERAAAAVGTLRRWHGVLGRAVDGDRDRYWLCPVASRGVFVTVRAAARRRLAAAGFDLVAERWRWIEVHGVMRAVADGYAVELGCPSMVRWGERFADAT